jgi:hypothetical protein
VDIRVGAVAVLVAAQVWPLLAFLGALLAVAVVWSLDSGNSVPVVVAWFLFKTAFVGLVGSFALHESAHVMALKRIDTVTHVAIERTAFRTSIVPLGVLTARQVVAVALAGPLACVAVGVALWMTDLDRSLAWWYLGHAIFLLPLFGDGRSLFSGLRGRGAVLAPSAGRSDEDVPEPLPGDGRS